MKVLDRIHELKAELMVVAVCLVAFGCGKVELDGIMTEADGARSTRQKKTSPAGQNL